MTTTARPATTTVETNVIEDAGNENPAEPETPTQKPTEKPKPAERPKPVIPKPTIKPAQNPAEKPAVPKPTVKPVQKPAEKPTPKPDETDVEDLEASTLDCTNQDFIPSNVDCRKVSKTK